MPDPFSVIVRYLIDRDRHGPSVLAVDVKRWLAADPAIDADESPGDGPAILTAAFLVALAGPDHELIERARAVLQRPPADSPAELITVYAYGLGAIRREIGEGQASDRTFAQTLAGAASVLADRRTDDPAASEAIWSVLYPEAVGLRANIDDSVAALRRRRIVQVDRPNPHPIEDAAREVLFTSNVLLGLPLETPVADQRDLDPVIAAAVARARIASQRYWFDHPIPIGVAPAANELLHGLRGLDAAIRAEPTLPGAQPNGAPRRLTCLLSVSATHQELREIARRYVELELGGTDGLDHVDVLVATETDVGQFVDAVITPAMARFAPSMGDLARKPAGFDVLGVDGEYGRHYSFLKAIAAIWHVFIDPGIRATFKIDLDQVFPQPELLAETGRTALQHLATPLWGAQGRDPDGRPVELGMIAGALVNEGDIARGLFTSDVPVPDGPRQPSDHVFFSTLPQAISTQAEMMERYDTPSPDGIGTALERIHVTGGTNGILVEALRRHRPFTPSFIGRAEDQAYALSVQGEHGPRLAYAHAAGLIMRHDKAAYAAAAIDPAHVGKLVGDDVRILTFSAYATAIAETRASEGLTFASIKSAMDPFSGGFISRLPITCVLLRFALRVIEAYAAGQPEVGRSYATIGSRRLDETLRSTADRDGFRTRIEDERAQWHSIYDTLDAVEAALEAGDHDALELRRRARDLIDGWRLRGS